MSKYYAHRDVRVTVKHKGMTIETSVPLGLSDDCHELGEFVRDMIEQYKAGAGVNVDVTVSRPFSKTDEELSQKVKSWYDEQKKVMEHVMKDRPTETLRVRPIMGECDAAVVRDDDGLTAHDRWTADSDLAEHNREQANRMSKAAYNKGWMDSIDAMIRDREKYGCECICDGSCGEEKCECNCHNHPRK